MLTCIHCRPLTVSHPARILLGDAGKEGDSAFLGVPGNYHQISFLPVS